jgi:hypothetical protein
MRICLATTTGFKKMITCSASEPLLAEAAFHLMSNGSASPVKYPANHPNLYCVDRRQRGELIVALIVMHHYRAIYLKEDGYSLRSTSKLCFHRRRHIFFYSLSLPIGAKETKPSHSARRSTTVICGSTTSSRSRQQCYQTGISMEIRHAGRDGRL